MGLKAAMFFVFTLLATGAGANTRIYSYVDADGLKHFTDTPDNNRYRLLAMSPHDLTESGEHYNSHWLARASRYDAVIQRAAAACALDANLLRAVIVVESGFNSRALSRRGAMGLMQLMPATAARFGVADLFDPDRNVYAGARYLKFLMNKFDHNLSLVLAAYNAGEDAVSRNGGHIPPYAETMAYVPKVLGVYRLLGSHQAPSVLSARLSN